MSVFNEQGFEKKLLALKDSQESISTLSDWCLQNKQHHKKIVNVWLGVLKKVRVENRLTLFYLANDVIQYSKRKNYDFVDSWATTLQKATTMVRHDKVMERIMRIFKIWGDRGVYSEEFLTDLRGLLTAKKATPATPKQSEPQTSSTTTPTTSGEFVPSNLFTHVGKCKELEDDTDLKLKVVNECKLLNLTDLDAFRTMLKDRKHADGVAGELDEAIRHVDKYKKALEVEISERKAVIDLLQQATKFYETEKSDAKTVFNAYRNFGSRVKSLKRKLDDLIPTLASPVPSPDVNAPSPSPDSDIDLPNDEDLSGIVECLGGVVESDSDEDLMSIISYHSSDEENAKYSYYELLQMPDHLRRCHLPIPDPTYSDSDLTELDDSFDDIEESSYLCSKVTNRSCPQTNSKPPPQVETKVDISSSFKGESITSISSPPLMSLGSITDTSSEPCVTFGHDAVVFKEPDPKKTISSSSENVGIVAAANWPLINDSLKAVHSERPSLKSGDMKNLTSPSDLPEDESKIGSGFNTVTNGTFLDISTDFLPSDEDLSGLLECLEDDLINTSAEGSS